VNSQTRIGSKRLSRTFDIIGETAEVIGINGDADGYLFCCYEQCLLNEDSSALFTPFQVAVYRADY